MIKQQIKIRGVLTVESGLHIGGTKDDIGISTTDNPIIRNPLTGMPYIPGSSIKGKMRSLFEQNEQAKGDSYPCRCGKKDCIVCTLFGAHMNMKGESGAPRVMFRDAVLSEAYKDLSQDSSLVEIKSETAIDRKTGTAANGSLRQMERIAAGVSFDYEIVILVWDGDNPAVLQSSVENGLRMIEATGLGAKTTAGYGKVNFHIGEDSYSVEVGKFGE